MRKLVDLVEFECGQGVAKKTFRLELFQELAEPKSYRLQLWEICSLHIGPNAGAFYTGPLNTDELSLVKRSSLLPHKYTTAFTLDNTENTLKEVIKELIPLLDLVGG